MSDLNDGDILSRTREQVNSSGLFQFVYIPEDGSDNIVSDWVDQEHKKKLVRQWVDGVKAAIIGRSQEKMQAAKDAALEERARKIRAEQFGEEQVSDGQKDTAVNTTSERQAPSARVEQGRSRVAASADPGDYVTDQLDSARERLRVAEEAQQDLLREVLAARKALAKWSALAAALETGDTGLAVDSRPSTSLSGPRGASTVPISY